MEKLRVVVRARPFSPREKQLLAPTESNEECSRIANPGKKQTLITNILEIVASSVTHCAPSNRLLSSEVVRKPFFFDDAFDQESSQQSVYEATAKPFIDRLFTGHSLSIFAYGATGCGKTHTTFGTDDDPGIVVRTIGDIFNRARQSNSESRTRISLSYLEIYNEQIRDLLPLDDQVRELTLREEGGKEIVVINLALHVIHNVRQVLDLVNEGNKRRSVCSTYKNDASSRSHAVLQIHITHREDHTEHKSKLSFIDLAGSERARMHTAGKQFIEGSHINKSLLALGNCINALNTRKGHIPYRDSKLTRLLKHSLSGKCLTMMVACVSPSSTDAQETLKTLIYAQRAMSINLKVKPHTVQNSKALMEHIETLKMEYSTLSDKYNQMVRDNEQIPRVLTEVTAKLQYLGTAVSPSQAELFAMNIVQEVLSSYPQNEMLARVAKGSAYQYLWGMYHLTMAQTKPYKEEETNSKKRVRWQF